MEEPSEGWRLELFSREFRVRDAMYNTFSELWAGVAGCYTGQPVIVSAEDKSQFSYEDADLLLSATVSYLYQLGLRQGDCIVVHADNHPEYLFLLWAALRLGLVVVPVDCSVSQSTLDTIKAEVEPSLVCCDFTRLARFDGGDENILIFDEVQGAGSDDGRGYSTQIEKYIDAPIPSMPQLDGTELSVILFTSGSTGVPKGVMLSQGALCRSGTLMSDAYGWCAEDVLLGLGAMHVMSGLRNQAMAALCSGTTILVAPSEYRTFAPAVVELCQHHKVTVITAVPALLQDLIVEQLRWQPYQMRAVRMVMVTGTGLDQKLATEVAELIDAAVLNYYGLTETCGLCCHVPLSLPQQGDGLIGVVIGAEAVVVDDSNQPVADGDTGELLIRSDNLMLGYLSQPELTVRVLVDGWFHTGDLVQRRSDGLLYLNGRRDDRIKSRGGEIVYPDEVSRSIQQHPGVVSATVCPVDAGGLDRELVAFIVPEQTASAKDELYGELRDWLHRQLRPAIIPERMVFYNRLPVNGSGKVDKRKLVQEYLSEVQHGN